MPCGFCNNWLCVSNIVYIFEKLAACCALAAVVSCIVVTLMVSMSVGVGLGYNYCWVEKKTEEAERGRKAMEAKDEKDGKRRSGERLSESFGLEPNAETGTVAGDELRAGSELVSSTSSVEERHFADEKRYETILKDYRPHDTINMSYPHITHHIHRTKTMGASSPQQNSTVMIVPLISQLNLTSLISQILARKENVTVHFVRM